MKLTERMRNLIVALIMGIILFLIVLILQSCATQQSVQPKRVIYEPYVYSIGSFPDNSVEYKPYYEKSQSN